jgi:hypothetical protein
MAKRGALLHLPSSTPDRKVYRTHSCPSCLRYPEPWLKYRQALNLVAVQM